MQQKLRKPPFHTELVLPEDEHPSNRRLPVSSSWCYHGLIRHRSSAKSEICKHHSEPVKCTSSLKCLKCLCLCVECQHGLGRRAEQPQAAELLRCKQRHQE